MIPLYIYSILCIYIYIIYIHSICVHARAHTHTHTHTHRLPQWLSGKQSTCNTGDKGDAGSIPGLGRSPRQGNGNPLQSYCLENPMDRGAWWATVHGVTKSQTQLSNFTNICTRSSSIPTSPMKPSRTLLPTSGCTCNLTLLVHSSSALYKTLDLLQSWPFPMTLYSVPGWFHPHHITAMV